MLLLKANEQEWRALHALADDMEPRVRAAFLAALESLSVNIGQLTDALEAGDVDAAVRAVTSALPQELREQVARSFRDLALGGAETAVRFAPFDVSEASFQLVNEAAVEWADQYAFDQIEGLNVESREAIRAVVRDSIREGVEPRRQARVIEQIVGLTERDAMSVQRLAASLKDDGAAPEYIDRQVARRRRRLLRRRAELIARTETIRASNEGQQLLWDRAVEDELIAPTTKKIWIATDDDRTCAICLGLEAASQRNPAVVGGEFEADMRVPPAHPGCRCAMGLVD